MQNRFRLWLFVESGRVELSLICGGIEAFQARERPRATPFRRAAACAASASKWSIIASGDSPSKRGGRIAEADEDDGNAGGLRRAQVDLAVADHHGMRGVAAGQRDRPGQMARIGLRHGKVSRPAMALK